MYQISHLLLCNQDAFLDSESQGHAKTSKRIEVEKLTMVHTEIYIIIDLIVDFFNAIDMSIPIPESSEMTQGCDNHLVGYHVNPNSKVMHAQQRPAFLVLVLQKN